MFEGLGVAFDDCAAPDQRPDVIAAIAGCYYGLPGQPSDWDTTGLSNEDAAARWVEENPDIWEAWLP